MSLKETVTVPAGHFTNVVKTQEGTAVEPGVIEFKYYAPGVGLILTEENLDANGVPQTRIPLESVTVTAIPLPPAAWTALATAGLLIVLPRGAANLARRFQA